MLKTSPQRIPEPPWLLSLDWPEPSAPAPIEAPEVAPAAAHRSIPGVQLLAVLAVIIALAATTISVIALNTAGQARQQQEHQQNFLNGGLAV